MSDTYGTDLSKRGYPGRLLPEQREAHARLAALPTWGRKVEAADPNAWRREAAEKANRTRIARGKPSGQKKDEALVRRLFERKGPAPTSRHGFVMHELVEIVGGKYAGREGAYAGSIDAARVFVRTEAARLSVAAKFVRRVAG